MSAETDHFPGYTGTRPAANLDLEKIRIKLQTNQISVTEDVYSNSEVNTTTTISIATSPYA